MIEMNELMTDDAVCVRIRQGSPLIRNDVVSRLCKFCFTRSLKIYVDKSVMIN